MNLHQSDQINEIVKAMIKAQAKISHAIKDKENPHFNSEFASLESVIDATKSAYNDNDCLVTQMPGFDESGRPVLITQISHSSGQWFRSYTPILAKDPNDPQKLGSGLSYARRYGLAAMANIGQEDDDANAASDTKPENPQDPNTWIFAFKYPEDLHGKRLGEMTPEEKMRAGSELAKWQANTASGKSKVKYPEEQGERIRNALREMLKVSSVKTGAK